MDKINDLIDRQAAIDALHMHLMYRMGTDSNKKRLDEWINNLPSVQPEKVCIAKITLSEEQVREAVEKAKSEIVQVFPSTEPEQRWIPCSERLPEECGWYICSLKDGRVNTLYFKHETKTWIDNARKNMFDLYNIYSKVTGEQIQLKHEGAVYWTDWVIAWMPLPEPYSERREE